VSGPAIPQIHPAPSVIGDAELLLVGAFAPQTAFGADVPLPAELVDLAMAAGAVELVDEEGAVVAEVTAGGTLSARARPASGPFRSLHLSPAELPPPVTDRVGVLVDRPLLAAEVAALAEVGEESEVLLLARTVDPQVPPDVLVRCLLAAARQVPQAQVVTVPFARRDSQEQDDRLAAVLLANYRARPVDVLEPAHDWVGVLQALDTGTPALGELLDPATAAVLRRWRPLRSERGLVVFFTGLSGSGKSTIARGLVDRLHETDRSLTVLDGDVARRMLSSGLGFSREDRDLNIRRLGWVAAEVARHGGVAVLAPIAPFAGARAEVRRMVERTGDLVLVWVATPLEECERRDRKGLYARARRGEIPDFTGISSPYEQPEDADLVLDTTQMSIDAAVDEVWRFLQRGGWVPAATEADLPYGDRA
jgi:sulfate adenylyltransferase